MQFLSLKTSECRMISISHMRIKFLLPEITSQLIMLVLLETKMAKSWDISKTV